MIPRQARKSLISKLLATLAATAMAWAIFAAPVQAQTIDELEAIGATQEELTQLESLLRAAGDLGPEETIEDYLAAQQEEVSNLSDDELDAIAADLDAAAEEPTDEDEDELAPSADEAIADLAEPATSQAIALRETTGENWKQSGLATAGLKFMIRGKEALAWAIEIDETGYDNPAIQSSYQKVLTIVNSLFVLGLLAIAAMWMFSLVVPRATLRRVIFVYVFAVVFVNFALPINRLLVDSTQLLQKTFLTQDGNPIGIVDIVDTPEYSQALGQNTKVDSETQTETLTVQLPSDSAAPSVAIGKLQGQGNQTIDLNGTIQGITESGTLRNDRVSVSGELPENEQFLTLNANQPLAVEIGTEARFDPNQEQSVFAFVLMLLTGLAYFLLALIFTLRIVILWGLMILSPILFLVAVFKVTRGYFYNWLSVYGRWLLIGPLAALGIAVIVNIWKAVGIPITSEYAGGALFGSAYNIDFFLPGRTVANTLSTTGQMMEYILFLIMLYLPIFFAYVLTRQKTLAGAIQSIQQVGLPSQRPASSGGTQTTRETEKQTEKTSGAGLVGGLKDLFGGSLGKFSATVLPGSMPAGVPVHSGAPSAANFLPEQLALTSTHDMLGMLGAQPGSRRSRHEVLQKLANPELIADPHQQKQVEAVRNEVDRRAALGDGEANVLKNEISAMSQTGAVASGPAPGAINIEANPEVNVNAEVQGNEPLAPNLETVIEKEAVKEDTSKDQSRVDVQAMEDEILEEDDEDELTDENNEN